MNLEGHEEDLKRTTPPSSEAGSDSHKGVWVPDPVEIERGCEKVAIDIRSKLVAAKFKELRNSEPASTIHHPPRPKPGLTAAQPMRMSSPAENRRSELKLR